MERAEEQEAVIITAEPKKDRKTRNAELKAAYEAEQAEKRAQRDAEKQKKVEEKAQKNAERALKKATKAAAGVTPQGGVSPETTLSPLFPPNTDRVLDPRAVAMESSVPHEAAAPEAPANLWEQAVAAEPQSRREQREAKKAEKLEHELASPRRKSKGSLPEGVQQMLIEKRLILARWRSRRIEPERAVEQLTALSATDADGAVWRLLPRNGGAALVKTSILGETEIVEPPRRRRPLVALVVAVLFGLFAGLAIWSSFDPVTSDGADMPGTTSSWGQSTVG